MIRPRELLGAIATIATLGCAGNGALPPPPSPEEIPELQELVAAQPGDPEAALLLAAAYREAGLTSEALSTVQSARAAAPDDSGLLVMAGLLHEDAGALSEARATYETFLSAAPEGELRDEVEARLADVRARELQEEVRSALAREAALADTPPDPATVGVFPFVYEGEPEWSPLGPALAELLVTDLAITGRITVLERVKVRALVEELALGASGLVEEATAARSGRILGSGHIVQGRIAAGPGQRLDVDAAVVAVGRDSAAVKPLRQSDDIERLFDLEKRLALDLHEELGVQLTPAERARVDERQTRSIQALLAFGRGLVAADAGDFAAAEQAFAEATTIDPGFGLARARRVQVGRAAAFGTAAQRMSGRVAKAARGRVAVQSLRGSPLAMRATILRNLTQKKRAVLAEVLGQDRVGTAILLELVFRRPGGAP